MGRQKSMAPRFVPIDRDFPLLLPPNLRDWVPEDHLVHFILDAVAALDLRQCKVNQRGTGSEQQPGSIPRMSAGTANDKRRVLQFIEDGFGRAKPGPKAMKFGFRSFKKMSVTFKPGLGFV